MVFCLVVLVQKSTIYPSTISPLTRFSTGCTSSSPGSGGPSERFKMEEPNDNSQESRCASQHGRGVSGLLGGAARLGRGLHPREPDRIRLRGLEASLPDGIRSRNWCDLLDFEF